MSTFGLTVHVLDANSAALCFVYMKRCWGFVPSVNKQGLGEYFFYAMYQGDNLVGTMICWPVLGKWCVGSMCFHSSALDIAQLPDIERLFLASIKPQKEIQTPLPTAVVVG